VRSPLIIRWKGKIEPGIRIDEVAGVIDLLPTLAELAGIEYQTRNPLDGISLKPLLLNERSSWNERYIISSWNGRVSIRSQNYRLDPNGELFNMINDPGQYKNISEEEPEITRQMRMAADQFRRDVLSEIAPDERRFTVGHPDFRYTQLPVPRPENSHGNIVRSICVSVTSSLCSPNWTSINDIVSHES
jgi:arylsulfatase A-like enzyme